MVYVNCFEQDPGGDPRVAETFFWPEEVRYLQAVGERTRIHLKGEPPKVLLAVENLHRVAQLCRACRFPEDLAVLPAPEAGGTDIPDGDAVVLEGRS